MKALILAGCTLLLLITTTSAATWKHDLTEGDVADLKARGLGPAAASTCVTKDGVMVCITCPGVFVGVTCDVERPDPGPQSQAEYNARQAQQTIREAQCRAWARQLAHAESGRYPYIQSYPNTPLGQLQSSLDGMSDIFAGMSVDARTNELTRACLQQSH